MNPSQGAERFRASFEYRPSIMGILNVTPDSFYDGGAFVDTARAVNRAARMLTDGASIIDIGGESTRPGHQPITAELELERVIPVVEAVAAELDVPISIDTTKADVARSALQAGAHIVNDTWGLQGDPEMAAVVAEFDSGIVVMHNRSVVDQNVDILADIREFFLLSASIAELAGVGESRIVLDPGIGFGKTSQQSLRAIGGIERLTDLGMPLLVGLSRKSFIGRAIGSMEADRLTGTIAANLRAIQGGARIIRVHDVDSHAQALRIWEATAG